MTMKKKKKKKGLVHCGSQPKVVKINGKLLQQALDETLHGKLLTVQKHKIKHCSRNTGW